MRPEILTIYLNEVKHTLLCPISAKKKILNDLRDSISSFLIEYPDTTKSELYRKFGTPEEIAQSFLEVNNPMEVEKQNRKKRKIQIALITIFSIIAVILAIYVFDVHMVAIGREVLYPVESGIFIPEINGDPDATYY